MGENPLFQDRGAGAIFGCVPFYGPVTSAITSDADADLLPRASATSVGTAVMPFNGYIWGLGLQLATAITAATDEFTVKVKKNATVVTVVTQLDANSSLNQSFQFAVSGLKFDAGDRLQIQTTADATGGADYNLAVDLWVGPRSGTL